MIHGTSVVLTAHSVVKLRFLNQDCLLHREPLDSPAWSSAEAVWQHDWGVCAWRENNPSLSVCKTHTHTHPCICTCTHPSIQFVLAMAIGHCKGHQSSRRKKTTCTLIRRRIFWLWVYDCGQALHSFWAHSCEAILRRQISLSELQLEKLDI